jgi:NADH-quinone oxidoreductase subunit M
MLYLIMLKMGLYSVIRWQLPLAPLAKVHVHFHGLGIAGVIYGSIVALKQKI